MSSCFSRFPFVRALLADPPHQDALDEFKKITGYDFTRPSLGDPMGDTRSASCYKAKFYKDNYACATYMFKDAWYPGDKYECHCDIHRDVGDGGTPIQLGTMAMLASEAIQRTKYRTTVVHERYHAHALLCVLLAMYMDSEETDICRKDECPYEGYQCKNGIHFPPIQGGDFSPGWKVKPYAHLKSSRLLGAFEEASARIKRNLERVRVAWNRREKNWSAFIKQYPRVKGIQANHSIALRCIREGLGLNPSEVHYQGSMCRNTMLHDSDLDIAVGLPVQEIQARLSGIMEVRVVGSEGRPRVTALYPTQEGSIVCDITPTGSIPQGSPSPGELDIVLAPHVRCAGSKTLSALYFVTAATRDLVARDSQVSFIGLPTLVLQTLVLAAKGDMSQLLSFLRTPHITRISTESIEVTPNDHHVMVYTEYPTWNLCLNMTHFRASYIAEALKSRLDLYAFRFELGLPMNFEELHKPITRSPFFMNMVIQQSLGK